MQNPNFIAHAKSILSKAGEPYDCYHEATFTGNKNELFSRLYYQTSDMYMEFTYTPEIAPCEKVLESGQFTCKDGIQDLFPLDKGLAQIKAQAYVGCKTQNGLRALLSPQQVENCEQVLKLLENQSNYQS